MKTIIAAAFLIFCISAVISTEHTTCFNYFLEKDGCVFSAASSQDRCAAPPKDYIEPVQTFTCPSGLQKRDTTSQLQRRYDGTKASFPIAGGTGICGTYDSNEELGVCLWSGAEQKNPTLETAGWLNGPQTSNCGKRVYIQRKGRPETVQYAKVIDGCYFNATSPDMGCFQVGLTLKLFNKFNPTDKEREDQKIYDGITWDFDNLNGQDPTQGPV